MRTIWGRFYPYSDDAGHGRGVSKPGVVFRALLAIMSVGLATVIVGYDTLFAGQQALTLQVGQVAPQDILAPFSISYESAVLTQQRIQVAMNSVRDVYDPPDPSVARQQVQLARQVLDYIADVRADEFATSEMLRADLRAIDTLTLTDEMAAAILAFDPERWNEIDEQIITVLERVMRTEIRDDTLRSTKQNIPNLVSVRFREDEVALISSIVEGLIRPNTFFNEERTRQAKQAAADTVTPEVRSFERGQIVVRGGSLVTEADMEALAQLGLVQRSPDRRLQDLLGVLLTSLMVLLVFGLYLNRFHRLLMADSTMLSLVASLLLVTLLGMRLAGPDRVVQPYLVPTAAMGLMLTALAGPSVAVAGTVSLAVLIGFMVNSPFALATMTLLGGLVGILTLTNTERFNSYFVSGLLIGLTNAAVVLMFFFDGYPNDSLGALTLVTAGLGNGLLSGVVALMGLYVISSVFNIPTSLRLLELTQPSQKLLQRLLREAPGTYQHSLQVANLAELAAERIGANAMLTRVGALYHDVGKMKAPHFFIENQVDGINPHERLNDPYRSARIIIDHVTEGDALAREYNLPGRVRDFIREHHGTTRPMYFYQQAVEQAGGNESAVDRSRFTYPGPRPRSRETAILMLADSCESAIRARRPKNKQEIADIIRYMFDLRVAEGQLDDSDLSLSELSEIQRVFVESLQGVFHPRIAYAGGPLAPAAASSQSVPDGAGERAGETAPAQVVAEGQEVNTPGLQGADNQQDNGTVRP